MELNDMLEAIDASGGDRSGGRSARVEPMPFTEWCCKNDAIEADMAKVDRAIDEIRGWIKISELERNTIKRARKMVERELQRLNVESWKISCAVEDLYQDEISTADAILSLEHELHDLKQDAQVLHDEWLDHQDTPWYLPIS